MATNIFQRTFLNIFVGFREAVIYVKQTSSTNDVTPHIGLPIYVKDYFFIFL